MRHGSTVWRTAFRTFHFPITRFGGFFIYPPVATGTSGLNNSVWQLNLFKNCPAKRGLAAKNGRAAQTYAFLTRCRLSNSVMNSSTSSR